MYLEHTRRKMYSIISYIYIIKKILPSVDNVLMYDNLLFIKLKKY